MREPATILLEPGKDDVVDVFGNGSSSTGKVGSGHGFSMGGGSRIELSLPSPALSAVDITSGTPRKMPSETPPPPPVTPGTTGTGINAENGAGAATASVFNLPYRMMFAVATQDTVAIHDTQQAGPVCLLTKLHYDSFTDMAWWVHCGCWGVFDLLAHIVCVGHTMAMYSCWCPLMDTVPSLYSTRTCHSIKSNNAIYNSNPSL
jgi:hypothetical protein